MPPDSDPTTAPRKHRLLIGSAAATLVIAFVILHLTSMLAPGSH